MISSSDTGAPTTPRPGTTALWRLLDGELPIPGRERYQPLRMGLIGIWEYDEEEFSFHDGRLILRGRNGSGKTKALEVTSPLLLDAILSARRLDPFGNSARSMRDNLLYRGRIQQVGYVWTEYGRVAQDGSHDFVTIGIGMHALETQKKIRPPWFFITPKRIGTDFSLYDADRAPLLKAGLENVLGKEAVLERARDYRAEVAKRLFGFSAARLHSLVDLLLTLRRPKLSEDFNVAKLSGMLVDGLPPVSPMLLEDLAGKFDELARDREEAQTLSRDKGQIDTFLTAYARLARRTVRRNAQSLLQAGNDRREAHANLASKRKQLRSAQKTVTDLDVARAELELRRSRLEARIKQLGDGPEMRQQGLVTELQNQTTEAEGLSSKATARHKEVDEQRAATAAEYKEENVRVHDAHTRLRELHSEADQHAARTALHDAHRSAYDLILNDPTAARSTLAGHIRARSTVLDQAFTLATQAEEGRRAHETYAVIFNDLLKHHEEAARKCKDREKERDTHIRLLSGYLVDWAERCEQLRLTEAQLGRLLEAVPSFGLQGNPSLSELVVEQARTVERDLTTALARQQSSVDQLRKQYQELAEERDRIEAQHDPCPPPGPGTRRNRQEDLQDGAPLWKLLEFSPQLSQPHSVLLEAALLDSGLLDAWITPDGHTLNADTLETVLLSTESRPARSLTEALQAVDHPVVPAHVTHAILASIELADQRSAPRDHARIGPDGTWNIGPLHGRTTATDTAYIGAAARTAEKQRRLAALDVRLHTLDGQIEEGHKAVTHLLGRLDDLDAERAEPQHKDRDLSAAQHALGTARSLFQELDQQAQASAIEKERLWGEQQHAENQRDDYVRPRGIPTQSEAINTERKSLQHYQRVITEALHTAESHLTHIGQAQKAKDRLDRLTHQLGMRQAEMREAARSLADKKERLHVLKELSGPGIAKILNKIAESEADLQKTKDEHEANHQKQKAALIRAAELGQITNRAHELAEDKDQARAEAVGDYRRLAAHGYLHLAGLLGTLGEEDDTVEAHAQQADVQLQTEPCSEQAINDARTDADEKFRFLQAELAGPDWRPRSRSESNLLLVSVLHNGEPLTVPQVQDLMANEIHTRRSLLDEGEHQLFTEVLLGRLGEHLRKRRAEAHSLIERMNALLKAAPTSSGLLMKIIWEPDPQQSKEIKEALETLDSQSSRHLSEAARERLIRFLVEQVENARVKEGNADWRVHLREALDYRRWNHIRLRYKPAPDQPWTNLTDEKQQKGSGGEKAVLLQFPLFVAAAAHYEGTAPTAPRPIYLDEAFAGIDAEMRGRCMGLLASLDLDFVMASHDEWGFHKEVPGVATYQLFRHPGIPGVLATPIIWDGTERHELPDLALRRAGEAHAGLDWDDEEDDLDEQYAEDDDLYSLEEHHQPDDDDDDDDET